MTDNADPEHEPPHSEPRLRPGELSMRSQRDGHVHTISLAGELDLANAHDVEAELIRGASAGMHGALVLPGARCSECATTARVAPNRILARSS